MEKKPDHFEGKSAIDHVIQARIKGKIAENEAHGLQITNVAEAFVISAKETATLFLILWMVQNALFFSFRQMLFVNGIFFLGWLIWKSGSIAQYAWLKLERLNRLIQEERWEIEHHRSQEKEELKALYQAKGFSGKLLDEVVDVLMADDNRLLQIMLEEELGLTLGSIDHPLKQAFGAFLGVSLSAIFLFAGLYFLPSFGVYLATFLIIGGSHMLISKIQKTEFLSAFIWSLALLALASSFVFFVAIMMKNLFLNL